jgi:leucyl aminopeptidase
VVKTLLTSGAASASLRFEDVKADADAIARAGLGAALAAYRFDAYRTKLPDDKKPSLVSLEIVAGDSDAVAEAWKGWAEVAAGAALARDLVSEPANILHPVEFARRAKELEKVGVEIDVLGEQEMRDLGMNALLGVGQGSEHESQLVVMTWKGAGAAKPTCLVGKGVCFDTGGISLKPGEGMWDMKGDMGGAAAVMGAMRAVAGRKAKANVIGVIGLVENMPDSKAQRPGDIVTSASGQTIEVLNTDAEGRLVLADALWYARTKLNPKRMIDLATLTGAMIITLAHEYGGLFSNDDDLAKALIDAGEASDEKVWRMPLGKAYDKMIDSPIADMKNIGGREGGSITAAQFLKRFVEDVPWAHLDIATTAWKSKSDDPREPTWATGWGVRILDRFVRDQLET